MVKVLLNQWRQVPQSFKIFFSRVIILSVIWKIAYLCFLLPYRIIDAPLTRSIGIQTANTLNWFSHSNSYTSNSILLNVNTALGVEMKPVQAIYYHNRNIVSIEDGCNGLELCLLYFGFIWCLPALPMRKLIFTVAGSFLIYCINVLRCAFLTMIYIFYPKYGDFAHHYLFTFAVYAFIILLWLLYSKKLTSYAKTA